MTERKPDPSLPLVLLVDDDVTMRILERASLEQAGFRVEEATDGEAAISIFKSLLPDVVLLDVMMPGLNGFEVCRRIRQHPEAAFTPILMVTGLEDIESIEQAFDSGATDFIAKPVHWTTLGHHVRYLLRSSQIARQLRESQEALRESQDRLTLATRGTGIGIWDYHITADCLKWDERMFELFDAPKETFQNTFGDWKRCVVPEALPKVLEDFEMALRGEKEFTAEFPIRKRDGDIRYLAGAGTVARDEQGRPVRVVGINYDITDRKKAEQALRQSEEKLEAQKRQLRKAESLCRMAGAIAHHFNNQLQVVMGNLELASEDLPQGESSAAFMIEAMEAARKAVKVSALMLTYLGQTSGEHELVKLSEICSLSLPMIHSDMPKGLILKTTLPSVEPAIRANVNQIHQVLTSLITNAWEAGGDCQNAIRLNINTVSGTCIHAEHCFPVGWQPLDITYVFLEVADAGCGIVKEDIEMIFDPFFSTRFTGRGLGLSVVLGIARAHGGAVTVDSDPGKGSIFRVFFPASSEEIASRPEKAAPVPMMESGSTVLLVEDEEMVRNMARFMLNRLNFAVLEARDGAEAVEMFRQHMNEIRCVLCDLTMPGMNGWETLEAIRKLSPEIPVVLSSGYDEAQVMSGDHNEWPHAFLGKPYQLKKLERVIRNVLTNSNEGV